MSEDANEQLVELLEKSLMIQLYSMGVPQGEIAKMLKKSKSDVNRFLRPLANRGTK
jgi:DNA-binding MarR family transcriptional regulator